MKKGIIIIAILIFAFTITACGKKEPSERLVTYQEAEAKFKEYANDYFQKNIKDTVSFGNITEYKLNLNDFASSGYNISIFKELKDGKKCDVKDTIAVLKVQGNELIDMSVRMSCQ